MSARPMMGASAGFSLIELLLVVGFISAALILAFVTYPKVDSTNKANAESQHLVVITGGVRSLYAVAQNYSTLSNNVLVDAKIVPDDLPISGSDISNVWGGSITVSPTPGNDLSYDVVYTGVPPSECAKLSTGVAADFSLVVVNYSVVVMDKRGAVGPSEADPSLAAAACNITSYNVLTFTSD